MSFMTITVEEISSKFLLNLVEIVLFKAPSMPCSLIPFNHSQMSDVQTSEVDVKLAPVSVRQ